MTPTPPIPAPLGYCAKCIANGLRQPATALVDGTSSCDNCVLSSYGVHDIAGVQHRLRIIDKANADPGSLVT
jgi:hypothetical protein